MRCLGLSCEMPRSLLSSKDTGAAMIGGWGAHNRYHVLGIMF